MNMHIRNLQEQSTRIYPVNMHEFYRCINYRNSHHQSLVMHRAQFYRCGHAFTSEFRNIKGAEHRSRCIRIQPPCLPPLLSNSKKSQSNQEAQDSGYTLSLPELIIFLKIVFLAFGNPAYSTETKKRLVELE